MDRDQKYHTEKITDQSPYQISLNRVYIIIVIALEGQEDKITCDIKSLVFSKFSDNYDLGAS